MGILHQKYSRGPYSCSAYYTTQSCCFLLQFTTRNVVTLALPLTRTRCVCFMTDTFNCKDLHIHLIFIIFYSFLLLMVFLPEQNVPNVSLVILTTAEHKDQLQRQWQTFFLVHLEFFWFPQNSFPDPRTHTDPGSLSTKTVRSTRVGRKKL